MDNIPRISKWIGGGYTVLAVFIIALFASIMIFTPSMPFYGQLVLGIVMVAVSCLLIGIVCSLYRTRYAISGGVLRSWSPFATVNLQLKDIAKAEKTMIPFSFRGFGASAYCGWFYIPTVGWTRVIITNLSDGVLITAKDGRNYLITPSNPSAFIKSLKSR